MSSERDRERLETILRVIADLDRRLSGMDFDAFSGDSDEIDLTAFRLSVIGENANKLSEVIKARNPALPWKGMYGFRNLVSHEYSWWSRALSGRRRRSWNRSGTCAAPS